MHRGMTHVEHIISRYAVNERVTGRGGVTESRTVNRLKGRGEGYCIDHLFVVGWITMRECIHP
jgi:hypothetical protein